MTYQKPLLYSDMYECVVDNFMLTLTLDSINAALHHIVCRHSQAETWEIVTVMIPHKYLKANPSTSTNETSSDQSFQVDRVMPALITMKTMKVKQHILIPSLLDPSGLGSSV